VITKTRDFRRRRRNLSKPKKVFWVELNRLLPQLSFKAQASQTNKNQHN